MNNKKLSNIYHKLRYYQRDAIKMALKYLKSDSKKQAMIQMPTGTGKTGVMAVISNCTYDSILIITPNIVIPEQIEKEVSKLFWEKIGLEEKFEFKEAIVLRSSKDINEETFKTRKIIIINIQKLLSLFNKNEKFEILKTYIGIILYDEGHREPAEVWSLISRSFKCKTILFTATPYRNDKTIFDIDKNYTYKYSITKAMEENYICKPEFVKMEFDYNKEKMIDYIYKIYKKMNKKIIVRITGYENIELFVNNLNRLEDNIAVGFHSSSKDKNIIKVNGSDINDIKEKYDIFIHENMLIEGLDFCDLEILVICNLFENTKSLIQQIGRVLRKPTEESKAKIYLPCDKYDYTVQQWELYIKYDEGNKNIKYIDNEFKEKFTFEKDFYKHMIIPKRANIYLTDEDVFDKLITSIRNKIEKRIDLTKVIEYEDEENKCWIMCYEKKTSCNYFDNRFYIENSLQFVLLHEKATVTDRYIFYYDTSRYSIPNDIDYLKELAYDDICKLMPNETEIIDAKYSNTNAIAVGTQTRNIKGMNLNKLPNDLTEKLSFCRNVTGKIESSKKKINRYLSPSNTRISDSDKCNYLGYINWCNDIVYILQNEEFKNPYFNRYAKIVEKPNDKPSSILLEFDVKIKLNDMEFLLESKYAEINKDELKFNFLIDKEKNDCILEEDSINHSIKIKLSKDYYVIQDNGERVRLSEYVNDNFRLYYADSQVMYFNKCFFKPNIQTHYNKCKDFSMWNNFSVMKGLKDCLDEKLGDKKDKTNWPKKSVFRTVIDEIEKNYKNIDYLVCDDLLKEAADFIALSTKENKCYFIHCKFHEKSLSASDFQDVCGQASKNIHYIMTTDYESLTYIEAHEKRWKDKWRYDGYEFDRCIKGDVNNFINKLKSIIESPYGKKEVWLVQSGLSLSDLKKELEKNPKRDKQQEQIPQLIWILQELQDNLKQVGAELKIFGQE